jgi:RNA polymerase sigma factor (sigma-70 family)
MAPLPAESSVLFHFCRVQLPAVAMSADVFTRHLERTYALYEAKANGSARWTVFFDNLYPLDWYVASACLEGQRRAWDYLFASRASRADCLLVDALRSRAARLYPGDDERQESAVSEFWSQLLVADTGKPVLARYDGQRPLVPWLIRVFQNWHVSQLRGRSRQHPLPEDDLGLPMPETGDGRWHEAFRLAARDWLGALSEQEVLILGLRLRYRQSQREVAHLLGVHEGTISRQTTHLADRCQTHIGDRLRGQGWTGEDLSEFVRTEMGSLLMDEPRLSADRLARILATRGKSLPAG